MYQIFTPTAGRIQTLRRLDINRVLFICKKPSWVQPSLYPVSTPLALLDAFSTVFLPQLPADAGYLVLTGEKNEDTSEWQSRVNLGGLTDGLADIVRYSSTVKVNRYRILAGWNLDDRRWGGKEGGILHEIADPKGSGHNDQTKGLWDGSTGIRTRHALSEPWCPSRLAT